MARRAPDPPRGDSKRGLIAGIATAAAVVLVLALWFASDTADDASSVERAEKLPPAARATLAPVPQELVEPKLSEIDTSIPSVPVSINWEKKIQKTRSGSFGLNCFKGFDPNVTSNEAFRKNIAYMNPGFLRFHSWELFRAVNNPWLDTVTGDWLPDGISRTFDGFPPPGTRVMINIPGFLEPFFKTEDNRLARSEFERFAAWCAELVEILNVRLRKNVTHWEVTNERDDPYWIHPMRDKKPDRVQDLADLYLMCAAAMRAVDPSIKIGAPAVARPDKFDETRKFVRAARRELDFFSYHMYASGSADESDASIYDKTEWFGQCSAMVVAMLNEESPDKHIEAHFNEYNISWTWETRDARMRNHKGAVFDALVLVKTARAGVDVTCAWNDIDGIYGKMSFGFELRPAAHLFHQLNEYCIGDVVESSVGDEKRCAALAVSHEAGTVSIVLVNRSNERARIEMDCGAWAPGVGVLTRHEIASGGLSATDVAWREVRAGRLVIPPHSVTVMTSVPLPAEDRGP